MKKNLIIICLIVVAGLVFGGVYIYVKHHTDETAEATEVTVEETTTHGAMYFDEEPEADYRLLGKWQNDDNPHWYRVYTSDWKRDDYFWGKEWYEDEDVQETDLKWHGNGWFLWRLEGNTVTELAVTDEDIAVIPHIYSFSSLNPDKMSYIEKRDKVVRKFHKLK